MLLNFVMLDSAMCLVSASSPVDVMNDFVDVMLMLVINVIKIGLKCL